MRRRGERSPWLISVVATLLAVQARGQAAGTPPQPRDGGAASPAAVAVVPCAYDTGTKRVTLNGVRNMATVVIGDFHPGPTLTEKVPKIFQTEACRFVLTPASQTIAFNVETTVTRPDSIRQLRLVAEAGQPIDIEWPDTIVAGTSSTTRALRLQPGGGMGAEYRLMIIATSKGGVADTMPIRFVLAYKPTITLRAGLQCGASLCFTKVNAAEPLFIEGPDASAVDTTVPPGVKPGATKAPVLLSWVTAAGRLQTTPIPREGFADHDSANVTVKFTRSWVQRVNGVDTLVNTLSTTVNSITERSSGTADLFLLAGDGQSQVQRINASENGVGVRVRINGVTEAQCPGSRESIDVFDAKVNADAPMRLGTIRIQPGQSGCTFVGRLFGKQASVTANGAYDRPATVQLKWGDPTNAGSAETQLDILPAVSDVAEAVLDRFEKERQRPVAYPGETAIVRLDAPGAGYFSAPSLDGKPLQLVRAGTERDRLYISLPVGRDAPSKLTLIVSDLNGGRHPVDVAVDAPQRPKDPPDFAWLESRDRRKTDSIPLQWGKSADGHSHSLNHVLLRFDASRIDAEFPHGVQYLLVDAELYDPEGAQHGDVKKCFAIVPPEDLNSARYKPDGHDGCVEPTSDVISISDLLEPVRRAPAQSSIVLDIRLDPKSYAEQRTPGHSTIRLVRDGHIILEPKLALPGPVIAFRNGKATAGITYAGAIFNATPVWGNNFLFNSAHSLSFQGGAVMGSLPSGSPGASALDARLSVTSGVSYVFRSMTNDATLDFFAGWVMPVSGRGLRRRDSFFVFRPGFSIPLGNGGG